MTSSTLRRRAPLRRTTRLRAKRPSRPYGGSNATFPKRGDFQRFIRERDENTCQLCGLACCRPVDVAHLLFKVGMGGRRKVSVNAPYNAACLGRVCHQEQETNRRLTAWLVTRLVQRHGYALPEDALDRLERYAAEPLPATGDLFAYPNDFDTFDRAISAEDGRKGGRA